MSEEALQASLFELESVLQQLAQSYPSTGIDAWSAGLRLAALVDLLVQWGLWVTVAESERSARPPCLLAGRGDDVEDESSNEAAMWGRLSENWSRLLGQMPSLKVPGSGLSLATYPTCIRAFCARHHALGVPVSGRYDDNDVELDELLAPAFALQRALSRLLYQRQSVREAGALVAPWWRRWFYWILGVVLLLGYGGYSWFSGRMQPRSVGVLPAGSVPGGIVGAYYQGKQFQTLKLRRTDKELWFNWRAEPAPGVTANYFSVRWAGYLYAPKTGAYKFCLRHDDGARLYLGTRTLLDQWGSSNQTHCRSRFLKRGWHRLIVQMYDNFGRAILKLSWQPPGAKYPVKIPSQHFCCKGR